MFWVCNWVCLFGRGVCISWHGAMAMIANDWLTIATNPSPCAHVSWERQAMPPISHQGNPINRSIVTLHCSYTLYICDREWSVFYFDIIKNDQPKGAIECVLRYSTPLNPDYRQTHHITMPKVSFGIAHCVDTKRRISAIIEFNKYIISSVFQRQTQVLHRIGLV